VCDDIIYKENWMKISLPLWKVALFRGNIIYNMVMKCMHVLGDSMMNAYVKKSVYKYKND
jgi:hypothetical protein